MWKHKEVIFPPSWHSFVVILVFTSTWYVHSNLIRYESIDMFACPHVPGHLSLVTCPCHMPPGGQAPAPVLAWWQCRGCKKYKCQGGCGWPGPASVLGDPKPPLPGTLLSRMEPPAVEAEDPAPAMAGGGVLALHTVLDTPLPSLQPLPSHQHTPATSGKNGQLI